MNRFYSIIFLSFYFLSLPCVAQEDFNYSKEYAGGININTNAGLIGGIMGKYARKIKENQYHYFGLEIVNVKHPKEGKVTNSNTNNAYISYKQNYLFCIRPQYGREFVLFNRAEEEGVQVNAIFAVGPTLGIVKPYFVEYATGIDSLSGGYITEYLPFDPDINKPIVGSGGIMRGFGLAKFKPGLNFKAALSFTFSTNGANVTGVEAGTLIGAFPSNVILIGVSENRAVFTSIFLNIFFGGRD